MSDAVARECGRGHGDDGSDRRGHPRGSGRQDALAQPAPVRRPGGDRLDRLYGPRQFRHQHPGRGEIRLCAAVGGARRPMSPPCCYQALSAKLGIVTGRNLAEMCRDHFPKPVVWALWIVSEVAAMATDLAEFLGGAIGLSLLLHIPLIAGMGVTAVLTYGILMFEGRGFRPIELIIGALVAAIALCYLVEMFIAPIDWAAAGLGSVVPRLPDAGAVTIAVGIVGATIMPHAIFLHSGLTQNRAPARNDRRAAAVAAVLEHRGPRRPRGRRPRQHGDGHHGRERVPRRPQRRRRDRDRLFDADAAARRRPRRACS